MLLGFKRQFERKIRTHEKRHTIRAPRKRRPIRVGDRLDCYVDPRKKTMRLLGRWPCTSIQQISITSRRYAFLGLYVFVKIDGIQLLPDEFERFAQADGFQNGTDFVAFWRKRLPFRGHVIHWDPTRPMGPPRKRQGNARETPGKRQKRQGNARNARETPGKRQGNARETPGKRRRRI